MIAPLVYQKKKVGVGFMPGSRLGYMPGARLGYFPGSHLGAVSDAEMQAAWDAGLDGPTLDALSAGGATDADIQALMAGTTDVPTLMAKYAGLQTTEGTTVTVTPQPPTAAPAAQLAPGSTFLYTASFNPVKAFITSSTVISDIAAQLPNAHMSMLSNDVQQSGIASTGSFTMTVLDSVGHALVSDAQSVLDSLLNQFTQNGKISSSITPLTAGSSLVPALPGAVPISLAPAGSFMTEQSVFPGITNEVLVFGFVGVALAFLFKGRR